MATDAMRYKATAISKPTSKVSDDFLRKELRKVLDVTPSSVLVGELIKRHKFGLLLTFTIVYVAFSLFGQLIVGLAESL